MMRTIMRTASLAVTVTACFAAVTGAAFAGSYVATTCSPADSSGPWTEVNDLLTAFTVKELCGGPAAGATEGSHTGAMYAEDMLDSPADIPDGSRAGWLFAAPAGTVITGISYYRRLAAYNDQDLVAGLYVAGGGALEQCKIPWPFVSGSSNTCSLPNNQTPITFSGLNTTLLFFGVRCVIVRPKVACGAGGDPLHAVQADLYSARVTLLESGSPALDNVGGGLWGGGVVSGSMPVTFVASDPTGIKEQIVRGDAGQTLVAVRQTCDFSLAQPCPQQPSGSLSVDTTRVADGLRTFSLVVTDAAGNTQVATSPSVVVDNYGPPAPTALSAIAESDGSNVVALSWRDAVNPPAPVARAMVQLCQATCAGPTSVGASGAARVAAPGPGAYGVRLWLIDTNGRGGPRNAAVTSVTVPRPGSGQASRTRVVANLKGRRLRVSGTLSGSGRVRVSWRSKVAGRTVGHGSRVVTVRDHAIGLTFLPSRRARGRSATIRVAVRSGSRIVAQARARRG